MYEPSERQDLDEWDVPDVQDQGTLGDDVEPKKVRITDRFTIIRLTARWAGHDVPETNSGATGKHLGVALQQRTFL